MEIDYINLVYFVMSAQELTPQEKLTTLAICAILYGRPRTKGEKDRSYISQARIARMTGQLPSAVNRVVNSLYKKFWFFEKTKDLEGKRYFVVGPKIVEWYYATNPDKDMWAHIK